MSEQLQQTSAPPRASFGDAREADEFVEMLEKFESGAISSDEYRQYRLSRGVYGQKQDGLHMIRVKIPQGILSSAQLRVLADVAEQSSRGYGHVTTRQNIQFHDVKPSELGRVLRAVADSWLTTREACSHTVRNVTGCPYAGVCHDAPFDVTPYAELVTRHFLRGKLGSGLPRKFKIAASGCPDDCADGAINDIGIIAQVRDGQRGFRILAGGGTATLSRSGRALHEFLPAEQLLVSCEAIVAVFNDEGERKNLQKARMKWAIERLGWEGYKARYQAHFDRILAEGGRPLPPLPEGERRRTAPTALPLPQPMSTEAAERFTGWRNRNVRGQVQPGYVAATAWLRLGDVSGVQLRALADLVERYGDGEVRTTIGQNLLLRWIPEAALPHVWSALDQIGLGDGHAEDLSDVVSCPGAETCRIAVTASRGVAQLVGDHLRSQGAQRLGVGDIKVSGCPNGCSQHHIAAIGLQGAVRKVGGQLAPQYQLMLGGGVDDRGATFGRLVAKIPARRVPEAIDRLIADFDARAVSGESPRSYFQRLALTEAKAIVKDLAELDAESAKPEDFIDLGSNVKFEVVALDGECAQ